MPTPYFSGGGVTLYCGDSGSLLSHLEDASVDCTLTDPPFGIDYCNNFTTTPHDKIAGDDTTFSYAAMSRECYRVGKDGTAMFCYSCWSEYPAHFGEVRQAGFAMKEPLVVQKRPSGKTDLLGSFQSNSDWIIFASKGRFVFRQTALVRNKKAGTIPNPGRTPVPEFKTRFPSSWFGDMYPWSTENPSTEPEFRHPTRKTVELMSWLILLATDPGGVVLDPFCGSGATLVAAKLTGRKAIGIEIEERHCEMVARRVQAATSP